jgi:hypothetical protein
MIKESDISFLNQFVKTLEDSFNKLEKAYNKKDSENFNKLKKIIVQTQGKISEVIG